MSELSPAARAVFESFNSQFDWIEDGVPGPQFNAIAAALRAAADHVLCRPEIPKSEYNLLMRRLDSEFRAIANELETQ